MARKLTMLELEAKLGLSSGPKRITGEMVVRPYKELDADPAAAANERYYQAQFSAFFHVCPLSVTSLSH